MPRSASTATLQPAGEAAPEVDRARAGDDVAQALGEDGVRQQRRGRGAVADRVAGAHGGFAHHAGAEVLLGILEVHQLGQAHVDGAVAKTVHLPPDVSAERVVLLIQRARTLGCKGVAFWRGAGLAPARCVRCALQAAPAMPSSDEAIEKATSLMTGFAERTGLTSDRPQQRYLWTDAFAVCNFLGLARADGRRALHGARAAAGRPGASRARTTSGRRFAHRLDQRARRAGGRVPSDARRPAHRQEAAGATARASRSTSGSSGTGTASTSTT